MAGVLVAGRPVARRGLVLAGAGFLCGCGAQHALPQPAGMELAAAQRAIGAAPPLRRHDRPEAEQAAMLGRVAARVAEASDPMCRRYLDGPCRFAVALARSDEVNAFASEGPAVTVTSGLLGVVENDAELAAVVAHEYGHHLARHLARAGTRMRLGAVIGSLVGGYLAGPLGSEAGGRLAGGAARLAYSQEEEREADYLAAFMVHRAGYGLEEAGRVWVRLAQAAGRADAPGLISTHPTGPQRLAAWRNTVAEIGAQPPGEAMPRLA
ncbi:M48 family metallopeptidase [Falsiroseomonas sp. CW058]|uniref:M48 family metallopeptidase n=1 Tax=Falsiroseomonas sp. CW058 TaxID=3388664 RepID=UPI003D31B8C5